MKNPGPSGHLGQDYCVLPEPEPEPNQYQTSEGDFSYYAPRLRNKLSEYLRSGQTVSSFGFHNPLVFA